MLDVRLKKTEKSEIFLLVQQSGLNPADFSWTDEDTEEWIDMDSVRFRISVLTHRPTEYYCKFGGTRVEFSPGPHKRVEADDHRDVWNIKGNVANLWLEELKKELDAPDLWASIGQEKVLSTAASSADLDNRPFTASEQSFIAVKLDEIRGYILEGQQLNSQEAEFVQREFADLKDSSRRFGRKDWLRVLLGVLIGQVINLALSPDKARGLFALGGTALQSLWGVAHGCLQ
jgi:hypothetical protein